MKKAEIIDSISSKTGLSKKDSSKTLDAVLDTISEAMAAGKALSFVGFGSFTVNERAARTARVPGTDKVIDLPATKVVKFKVGKQLKEAVAKG